MNNRRHRAKWVRVDSHSQNKQKYNNNNKNDENNIKLRPSLDIYNKLINDKTLNINLNNVWVGYSKNMQHYQLTILDWLTIDKGGDIPMESITNFVFYLNNGNKLILWDKKTQFDRLFCSGITKQDQSLAALLKSAKIQSIQSKSQNMNEEKKEDDAYESMALCKFYGAGFCYRGLRCDSLHNGDKISKYEEQWLNGKIVVNQQCLPLISLAPTFSIQRVKKQKFDYILVLDLEGKDEIIELPCILIDLLSMKEVSRFHCWTRPTNWDKGGIPKYMQTNNDFVNIKSKAIPFGKALRLLSEWLFKFDIYLDQNGEYIKNPTSNKISKSFLCAICGNWDIKTQIPKQCRICNIKLPKYFNQWMNIKDFALNIYPQFQPYQVKGMFSLLKRLKMDLYGTHHLGMDDTYNIARIVMQFAMDNAIFDCTAYRDVYSQKVIYKNNNRRVSQYHTSKRSPNNQ